MDFGKKLRLLLWHSGFSNSDLVRKLGKNKAQISRWVNGNNKPNPNIIKEISEIFNVPYEWLIDVDYPILIKDGELSILTPDKRILDSFELNKVQSQLGNVEKEIASTKLELNYLRSLLGGQSFFKQTTGKNTNEF